MNLAYIFDMATFGINYSFETVNKCIVCCTNVGLWNALSFPAKYCLERVCLWYLLVLTLAFKIPQIEKSNGFASEEFDSYWNAEEIKCGTLFCSHSWFARALWDSAESYWNVHGLRPKCLHAQGFNTVSIFMINRRVYLNAMVQKYVWSKIWVENGHRQSLRSKPLKTAALAF